MTASQTPRPGSGTRLPLIGAALLGAAAIAVVALVSRERPTNATAAAAVVPASQPAPAFRQLELVHAETFQLERGYQHMWRADQPLVDRGWLLVLQGDPELLAPRQLQMPVLYVGAQTAERVNTAQPSGKLVVLVPGDFALASAPIFLGAEALPEEVRPDWIQAELAGALASGAKAPAPAVIERATVAGRTYADDYALRQRAIDLVELHSPEEKDLIAGWRAPLVK